MQVNIPFWSQALLMASCPETTGNSIAWNGSPPRPIVYSPAVAVTAVGGTGVYTYQWQYYDEVASSWVDCDAWPGESGVHALYMALTSPQGPSTRFAADSAVATFDRQRTHRCRVADSSGAYTYTNSIDVTLEREATG